MNEKISVLMGIYNCANTLPQAVAAIQAQTHTNWELILCDDGSDDDTWAVAQVLAQEDSRIVLLRNERNMGLNHTLNRCLSAATGSFLARMDGDDDCDPSRFARQLQLLRDHPEIHLTSCPMVLFDETGIWGKTTVPECPTAHQVVTGTPISHAAVLLRRECLDTVGGYSEDPKTLRVEDVDLWIRLYAAGFRCRNLTEPLYHMRNDRHALNRRKYRYRVNSVRVRLRGCRLLKLGVGSYAAAVRPMVNGLVPAALRQHIRKIQRKIP